MSQSANQGTIARLEENEVRFNEFINGEDGYDTNTAPSVHVKSLRQVSDDVDAILVVVEGADERISDLEEQANTIMGPVQDAAATALSSAAAAAGSATSAQDAASAAQDASVAAGGSAASAATQASQAGGSASAASASATEAAGSATAAGGFATAAVTAEEGAEGHAEVARQWAVNPQGQLVDATDYSSYHYAMLSKGYAEQAEAIVGIGIATTEQAGIVKPDGETISVGVDGLITVVGGGGDAVVLSDAVDGVRRAEDGIGASEWAVSQARSQALSAANSAGAAASAAQATADSAFDLAAVANSTAANAQAEAASAQETANTAGETATNAAGSARDAQATANQALTAATTKATTSQTGIVQPDGTTIAVNASGVISAVTASGTAKGVVAITAGNGLTNTSGTVAMSQASSTAPGTMPAVTGSATNTTVTRIGAGTSTAATWIDRASLVPSASLLGMVRPDGTTITVDANGVISSAGAGGGALNMAVYSASGSFVAPVTADYSFEVVGGGGGATASNGGYDGYHGRSGGGGGIRYVTVSLNAGQSASFTIGAGGNGPTGNGGTTTLVVSGQSYTATGGFGGGVAGANAGVGGTPNGVAGKLQTGNNSTSYATFGGAGNGYGGQGGTCESAQYSDTAANRRPSFGGKGQDGCVVIRWMV